MPNPSGWDDMSDYVVHFTKPSGEATAYDNMMAICGDRALKARAEYGFVRKNAPDPGSQRAVCFSEVPPHLLCRIAKNRGSYGIGFSKKFVRKRGALPIWYLYKDSPTFLAMETVVASAKKQLNPPDDPIWKITPFVDAPGQYKVPYFFEWEREWRHIGEMCFHENDVSFLIIPEELHGKAREFFESAAMFNDGPPYLCPYIDPYWNKEQVDSALSESKPVL